MNEGAAKALTGMSSNPMQSYSQFIGPAQENLRKASEAKAELAGAERGMEAERSLIREQQRGGVEQEFAKKVAEAPQRQQLEAVSTQVAEPFIPTRETAGDLGNLFSLINIAGFAIGAGGKRNAQAAMSAMNGMLQGYQQGRADLYKKEKDIFDTNMKQLKARYDMLDKQLKEAIETYKVDREAGLRKADLAYAQAGADFLKKYSDKVGLAAMYDTFKQAYDTQNRAWTEKTREEDRAERLNRAARAEERAIRREERAEARFEKVIRKTADSVSEKKEGKPLPDKQTRDLEGLASIEDGLVQLAKDWKPEYAQFGMPFGLGAEQMAEAQRRGLGGKQSQDALSWWSRYERYQAPNRHALFGATLTGNELKNYQSFTAKKSDSSDTVQTMLNDQLNFVRNQAANKIFTAESAGYKVPKLKEIDFQKTFTGGQAAAAPASQQVRAFNTIQEAEAANLPKGTKITIGGRPAEVE